MKNNNKIIRISNGIPYLVWRKIQISGNQFFCGQIGPEVYQTDKRGGFGKILVPVGVVGGIEEIPEILKKNLEVKKIQNKVYLVIPASEKREPDCYWLGVTQWSDINKNARKRVKVVMRGWCFRKSRHEGMLPRIKRTSVVFEIPNNTEKKIEISQTKIWKNGCKVTNTIFSNQIS